MGAENEKTLYYNILEKELKKTYDEIQNNKFNEEYKEYIFKSNQFNKNYTNKKNCKTDDWKSFLLDSLEELDSSNENSWEFSLYNYIDSEYNKKMLEENYIFENQIFYNQFFLKDNPQQVLKDSANLHEPVLYLLHNEEQLDDYAESSKKKRKKNKNKKINKEKNEDQNIIKTSNEIELTQINELKIDEENNNKNSSLKINKTNILFSSKDKKLTIGKMVESESLFLKKKQDSSDLDYLDEYNSYLIRKLINFIRRQLENRKNNHPIYNIINKFSEIYSDKINDYYKSVEDDEEKIENKKIEIIKDIQNFIDIMVKALKLFYMKSINYDIFKCYEQDDFINLICYFLFNI